MTIANICKVCLSVCILAACFLFSSQASLIQPVQAQSGRLPASSALAEAAEEATSWPTITWTGSANNNWNDIDNWDPQVPPNEAVNCRVAPAARYPLLKGAEGSSSTYTCGKALTIDPGAEINVLSNANLSAETALVNGKLNMYGISGLVVDREVAVGAGGLISQLGMDSVGIILGDDQTLAVSGTLSVGANPFRVSGPSGKAGSLLVMPGGVVEILQGGSLAVTGSLVNNGTLQETKLAAAGMLTPFGQVTNGAGTSPVIKYSGIEMQPDGSGIFTAAIHGNQPCGPQSDFTRQSVKRCYQITSLPIITSATVRFYYTMAEVNLQLSPSAYVYNALGWDSFPSACGDSSVAQYVEAEGIPIGGTYALRDSSVTIQSIYIPQLMQ